ncbi:NAD-dependent epimerase/dehydratase family protein [Deinococcus sp. HMF7620]|uniref:NAD-dependent epimerase/dehydratase family protein n=1 Tax=Deinococcus arboris TaxID=2682977 RepID=A0A7C9I0M5_9DEIO|nr:hybrid nucleoside-diphosphate sugar epimerase/sugar transferase [Deinococcus arboris]MVN87975.1 NAD-dependent epimerase/dehydratase family protein [Deinococcus arboris]
MSQPETVLVVGASGFVGRTLCQVLLDRGYQVIAASRTGHHLPAGVVHQPLADLNGAIDWLPLLHGVSHVVYLAARVHVMNDELSDPLSAYRALNTAAPVALARAAAPAGVHRFVYLSSVKVNGEASVRPLTEDDLPVPTDSYGQSKWEAEQQLLILGAQTGLSVSILRPPLVYGPGVKANFLQLAWAVARGVPLPLAAVQNARSMVYVGNLADAIAFMLGTSSTSGQVFFVTDGQDLSTPDVVRGLAQSLGRSARLWPLSVSALKLAGQLLGRQAMVQRLTDSLQVDSARLRRLGWQPPFTAQEGLSATVRALVTPQPTAQPWRLTIRQRVYLKGRRVTEPLLAGVLLLWLLPVLLLIALGIRVTSPGPVLFLQTRAGRGHRPYTIFKFRTMRAGAPELSTEDMRRQGLSLVTPFGAFLRRTSLDELPQLLNVVRGEMSFVGPRPALLTQIPVLSGRAAHGVDQLPPGITGLAQVTGRDDLADEEKVKRDVTYLRHVDLLTDLLIVWSTLRSVFRGRGTY